MNRRSFFKSLMAATAGSVLLLAGDDASAKSKTFVERLRERRKKFRQRMRERRNRGSRSSSPSYSGSRSSSPSYSRSRSSSPSYSGSRSSSPSYSGSRSSGSSGRQSQKLDQYNTDGLMKADASNLKSVLKALS